MQITITGDVFTELLLVGYDKRISNTFSVNRTSHLPRGYLVGISHLRVGVVGLQVSIATN